MLFPWISEDALEGEVKKMSLFEIRAWMMVYVTPSVFAKDVQSKVITIMSVLADEYKRRTAAKEKT